MIAIINHNNDIDIDIGYQMLDRQITHHTQQANGYQMFHGQTHCLTDRHVAK